MLNNEKRMERLVLVFAVWFFGGEIAFGQPYPGRIDKASVPRPYLHAEEEYLSDGVVDSLRWLKEKPGLHVSFATTDMQYFRREVPDLSPSGGEVHSVVKSAWRGERLNFMVLVWSPDTLRQIRFRPTDLVNDSDRKIDKKNIRLRKVHYVLSDYPYGVDSITCGESPYEGAFLMPDKLVPLDGSERFDVPGRTVRPVWLSVVIPSQAEPSSYMGTMEVKTENAACVLSIRIIVQHMVLPPPSKWKFRLDLWQNPWVSAYYYNVKPWSDEHKSLLKNHLRLYADAGGKSITTYAVYSPWADITYRVNESMIEWIRQRNGSWKFDYSIFDQYVQLAMEVGIDKAITIYTPIPWGNRFRYLDEETGNYIYEVWSPESSEFKAFWNTFLGDLKLHLEAKGWFGKTYLGINENELAQTLTAIKVIKDHSPQWRITYAGDWHRELDSLLDDYSCILGNEPSFHDVKERVARGSTSTYYICCTPPKPNTFVSSCPAEARWLGWYAAAHNYDGLLRWAYDSWPADPGRDARHVYWAAGDCFLVYPGATSSIRLEKLREGIVDFEKITTVRALASKSSDRNSKALMQELDDLLRSFVTKEHFEEEYFSDSVHKGERILQELTNHLGGREL